MQPSLLSHCVHRTAGLGPFSAGADTKLLATWGCCFRCAQPSLWNQVLGCPRPPHRGPCGPASSPSRRERLVMEESWSMLCSSVPIFCTHLAWSQHPPPHTHPETPHRCRAGDGLSLGSVGRVSWVVSRTHSAWERWCVPTKSKSHSWWKRGVLGEPCGVGLALECV